MIRWLLPLVLLIALGWAGFRLADRTNRSAAPANSPRTSQHAANTAAVTQPAGFSADSPAETNAAGQSAVHDQDHVPASSTSAVTNEIVPDTPESVSIPPETILENLRTTLRQYGSMFGGNPVGTNPEITEALQGKNPRQVNFLKADGNRVSAQGQLVDAWGTPYFFHQLSGTETEIRSAGLDRKMWTEDDLVIGSPPAP
jgi:hypothetical protein